MLFAGRVMHITIPGYTAGSDCSMLSTAEVASIGLNQALALFGCCHH